MDGKRTYQIVINGVQESANAVESLNKQLSELENRIKALEKSSVKINASSSGGGSTSSGSKSSLNEEEKLARQIEQIDAKREAYSKEIYQNYLAAKDVLDETVKDQKQISAQERLQANNYTNTMAGMKQELKDLKTVMNGTDLGDDAFKQMSQRAGELTNKLKEIEQAYGQYGRNVGNYASAFDKIRVSVGNTVREYDNYKKAVKELKQERFQLSQTLGQESEQYKEIDKALKQLESDYNDLNKSSKFMDNLLDTMQSFTALASVGQGVSALFGFDDNEIQKSIQKLVALQNVLKGIETIQLQMQRNEGFGKLFNVGSQSVDKFVAKLTGAKITMDGLTASSRGATIAVRGLSMALKSIGIGFVIAAIPEVINGLTNIAKEMTSTQSKVNVLDEALASLNNKFKDRNDLLASSYLKGEINDNELLAKAYGEESDYLSQQIVLLRERAALMNEQEKGGFFSWGFMDSFTKGGGFTGERMNGSKSVESYSWLSDLIPLLKITVNNTQEVEEEFKKCQEAIHDTQDYFTKWGSGLVDWVNSLFTSVSDTERVMRGLGNTRLNEFVGSFAEANQKFKEGKISAEQFAQELGKLKGELNSSEVLRSVIANLDKYIPDERVREAVNNIINQIIRLDDAFNMTSPEQVRHWMQVRIDAMAEGTGKIKAQIDADEKYEIAQYGKTQEQINLIHAKYNRKRQDELKKYNEQAKNKTKQHARELESVEKEIQALRIQNMKDGLDKQLAQLEEERRQKLQKAKDDGIRVGELTIEINKLYDKKIQDAKEEWAYRIEQVYTNMWNKIYQINHSNAQSNFDLIEKEIKAEYNKLQDLASSNNRGVNLGYSQKNRKIETTENGKTKVTTETDESYTKRLASEYQKRKDLVKSYYSEIEGILTEEENNLYKNSVKKLEEAKNNELRTLKNSYSTQDHEIEEHYKKGEITLEQYNEAVERLNKERGEQEAQIQLTYQRKIEDNEKAHNDRLISFTQDTDDAIVNHFRESMEALSKVNTSEDIYNKLGFLNISAIKKRNDQVVALYKQMAADIVNVLKQLETKLQEGDYTQVQRAKLEKQIKELKELLGQLGVAVADTADDTDESWKKLIGQISFYASQVGSALSSLVGAIGDYTDQQYENEINQLQEYIDEYEEKLNEQKEITQQHASEIDSIEDELATARGDRRQHLIDQLNAQMAAQRASLAEEKRVEKEKKKLEEKKDREEKKRLEAQKKQQKAQAIINGAVAATNALATPPIWLGIALAAVIAAATAVEIATINSQKFADGGVIAGKSHSQGGVKVLGGRAEVEGGEYITNKVTTSKNIDLLDYINSKKKKIDINDLMDFYSSTPRKTIKAVRTKFEDGGYLPTLPNALDVRDQLQNVVVNQDNRPIYVSVVDINNKQEDVRRVQTLAGL